MSFTFMHLANIFIKTLSVLAFPENRTYGIGVAYAVLFELQEGNFTNNYTEMASNTLN